MDDHGQRNCSRWILSEDIIDSLMVRSKQLDHCCQALEAVGRAVDWTSRDMQLDPSVMGSILI